MTARAITSLERQTLDISMIELQNGAWRNLHNDISVDINKLLPVISNLVPVPLQKPGCPSLISNLTDPTDTFPFKIVTLKFLIDLNKYVAVNMENGGTILQTITDIRTVYDCSWPTSEADGGDKTPAAYVYTSNFFSRDNDNYLPVGDIIIPWWDNSETGSLGPLSMELLEHIPILLIKNDPQYCSIYPANQGGNIGCLVDASDGHLGETCGRYCDDDCDGQGCIGGPQNLPPNFLSLGHTLFQATQPNNGAIYAAVSKAYLINSPSYFYNVLFGNIDVFYSRTPFFTFCVYGNDYLSEHNRWGYPEVPLDILPINAMRACCSNVDTLGLPICGDRYFTDFSAPYAPTTECSTIMDTYCTEDNLMTDQCNSYCSHSPNNVCDIPLSSFCDKACYPDTDSTEYASGNCAVNKFTKNPNFVKTCGCAFQQDFYDNWRDSLIKAINPDLAKFFEGIGSIVPQCDYPDCAGGTALKLRSQETEGCPNKDVEVCLSQTNVNIGEAVNSKININTLENCIESKYTSGNPGNPKLPSFPDGNQTSKIIVIVVVVAIILLIVIALIYFFV